MRALAGDPVSLDPQRAGDTFSFEILRDLFEGLTTESPSGQIIAGAAERWVVSADGLTYDFFLRPNARWSNGEPVTASDFVRALRFAVDPRTGSLQAGFLRSIAGAKEILEGKAPISKLGVSEADARHLIIKLDSPTPYFLTLLSNAVAYPRYGDSNYSSGEANGNRVSNGPYKLTIWNPGSKIVLEKSLQYRESHNVHFRTVTYISMPDSAMQSRAFRSGNIDITDSIPDSEARNSSESSGKNIQVGNQLSVVYYVFNVAKFPLKASMDLRRALILAVDRTKLSAQLLGGGEVPALSFVPYGIAAYPRVTSASDVGVDRREVDLRLARFMYHRAGYSKNHPLSLVLLCPTNSSRRLVSVAVSEMWREALGVKVQLVYLDYRSYLAARSDPGRWDVISEGWNADFQDPINFLDIFSSTSHQNVYGFSDSVYDELLRRSASTAMFSERYKILASAEKRLLEAQVVLPLYFPVTRRFVSRRIENAFISPMNHNYSRYWRATN